jgi:hypothetical protein
MAPALIVGAMAGGPIGLAAIGGVAAVAAVEYLGAGGGGGPAGTQVEDVGRPSEVVLQALERLEAPGPSDAPPPGDATGSSAAAAPTSGGPSGADDGRSIWRDLPDGAGAGAAGLEPGRLPPAGPGPIEEEEEDG